MRTYSRPTGLFISGQTPGSMNLKAVDSTAAPNTGKEGK